jgi:N-acetyl-gamma-glutamylphosphate reductase
VLFPSGSLFETTKALIITSEFIVCLVRNYYSLKEWLDYYKPERMACRDTQDSVYSFACSLGELTVCQHNLLAHRGCHPSICILAT